MKSRAWVVSFQLVGQALLWPTLARAQRAAEPTLYQQLQTAAVEVLVDRRLSGSGCFVDAAGHVLTAAHVLGDPGPTIELRSESQGRLTAEVVAVDDGHDLALLRATAGKEPFPFRPLAKRQGKAGETVFLYGAPVFRHGVLLRGVLGREGTTFEYCGGRMIEALHVSGASPPGTSGGPWVNLRGELVGVQSSLINSGPAPVGIAIIAPLSSLRKLLETRQTATTATLGTAVEEVWGQEAGFLQKLAPEANGLIVRQLEKDGPAAQAGIHEWDLITHVDGQPVTRTDAFMRSLRSKRPGDQVKLRVCDRTGVNPREVVVKATALEAKWLAALGAGAKAP